MSDEIAAVARISAPTAVEFDVPTAPADPLPAVPAMPSGFVPPRADEHLRPDAHLGADAIT